MVQTSNANIVGILIIISLVIFAVALLMRKKEYSNPIHEFLGSSDSGGSDIDNKMIDFYHKVLTKYVDYYRRLNQPNRKKFIDRLHAFIEKMEFQGQNGQEINLKVCVLCAAGAIQISMGLDTYLFNTYHTIVVYPRQFFSERHGAYVKGGAGNGDAIFFSLEDLIAGFENPHNALNVGLHEMAHAIHVEYFDAKFEAKFPNWERVALQEVTKLRHEKNPVLRNYAAQNKHELFAVCIETFFEQPNEFKAQIPVLYDSMCDLLNQRPV